MPWLRTHSFVEVADPGQGQEGDAPICGGEDAVVPFAACCLGDKRSTDERGRAHAALPLQYNKATAIHRIRSQLGRWQAGEEGSGCCLTLENLPPRSGTLLPWSATTPPF